MGKKEFIQKSLDLLKDGTPYAYSILESLWEKAYRMGHSDTSNIVVELKLNHILDEDEVPINYIYVYKGKEQLSTMNTVRMSFNEEKEANNFIENNINIIDSYSKIVQVNKQKYNWL